MTIKKKDDNEDINEDLNVDSLTKEGRNKKIEKINIDNHDENKDNNI